MKIRCYGCSSKLDVSELAPFDTLRCPECRTKLIVPKAFGDLLLEEEIADGELVTVYRSMDITLDREIVVKVLKPDFAGDPAMEEAFINEARLASAINHPNVVPIYSCGNCDGSPYLVMQYMEGGTLAARLGRAQATPELELEPLYQWLLDAARGLESAQIRGILHRDVIPSNILFDGDGNVKIGDFGIHSLIVPKGPLDLNAERFAGIDDERAAYLAPERITTGDERTTNDIYGLGASFYHAIAGRPPHPAEDWRASLRAKLKANPPPVSQFRDDLHPAIGDLIMCMLQQAPSERPETYADIVAITREAIAETKRKQRDGRQSKRTVPSKPRQARGHVTLAISSDSQPILKPAPAEESRTVKRRDRQDKAHRKANSSAGDQQADSQRQPRSKTPLHLQAPPKTGLLTWFSRFFLLALLVALSALIFGHVTRATWYQDAVLPHIAAFKAEN